MVIFVICNKNQDFEYDHKRVAYETQRLGPDHQCGPINVRGPIDLCGPKVPLRPKKLKSEKPNTGC